MERGPQSAFLRASDALRFHGRIPASARLPADREHCRPGRQQPRRIRGQRRLGEMGSRAGHPVVAARRRWLPVRNFRRNSGAVRTGDDANRSAAAARGRRDDAGGYSATGSCGAGRRGGRAGGVSWQRGGRGSGGWRIPTCRRHAGCRVTSQRCGGTGIHRSWRTGPAGPRNLHRPGVLRDAIGIGHAARGRPVRRRGRCPCRTAR